MRQFIFIQGKITVDSIDDKEDMQFADEAYDILGFTQTEKYDVYKVSMTGFIFFTCLLLNFELILTFLNVKQM